MKRFFLLLLGLLLFGTAALTAQDVIVRKDGTTILAKVEKVGESEIEYRKWDNLEGPTYHLPTTALLSINYQNGTRDTFDTSSPQVVPATPLASATTQTGAKPKPATTTTKKSGWYRDEKAFVMNPELFAVRIGLEGEGYVGCASSAIYAWNLGRFFHAGFGCEFYSKSNSGQFMMNIFGDFCWYMLGKKKVTPFLDYRVGLSSIGGLYLRYAAGMAFGNCVLSCGPTFVGMIDEDVPALDIAFGIHF